MSYHKQFVNKGDFCVELKVVESTNKQLDYLFWFSKSEIVSWHIKKSKSKSNF